MISLIFTNQNFYKIEPLIFSLISIFSSVEYNVFIVYYLSLLI